MSRLYAHKLNPHYSADHADKYFQGRRYIVSLYPQYPIIPRPTLSEAEYEENKNQLVTL